MTAIAVQVSGRLTASMDALGTAKVWRASDLMPLASVSAATPQQGSQRSRQDEQPKSDDVPRHSSAAGQSHDRAVAWLPAPDATVGVVPASTGVPPRAKATDGQHDLLILADRERMRVWTVPARPDLGRAAEPREVASAPMPEGCQGVCQLAVLTDKIGSTDNSSSTASAIVLARAQAAGDGEVVYAWQVARNEGSHGIGVQLTLVEELQIADVSRHSDVDGTAPAMSPQGSASVFATLLSHESVQVVTADPAAGQISLYRLHCTSGPGSQSHAQADTSNAQRTQLVATASLRRARGEVSQPTQTTRTANGEATPACIHDMALSASARQLAAVGTQGARVEAMDTARYLHMHAVLVPRLLHK